VMPSRAIPCLRDLGPVWYTHEITMGILAQAEEELFVVLERFGAPSLSKRATPLRGTIIPIGPQSYFSLPTPASRKRMRRQGLETHARDLASTIAWRTPSRVIVSGWRTV